MIRTKKLFLTGAMVAALFATTLTAFAASNDTTTTTDNNYCCRQNASCCAGGGQGQGKGMMRGGSGYCPANNGQAPASQQSE